MPIARPWLRTTLDEPRRQSQDWWAGVDVHVGETVNSSMQKNDDPTMPLSMTRWLIESIIDGPFHNVRELRVTDPWSNSTHEESGSEIQDQAYQTREHGNRTSIWSWELVADTNNDAKKVIT